MKRIYQIIIAFFIQTALCVWCHAASSDAGQIDSLRLKECMNEINEINSLALTKAYLEWISGNDWVLTAHNNKLNASKLFLDEFSVYKDSQERIRKVIYTNYEYGYDVMVCYYDTFGQLIRCVFELGGAESYESYSGYQFADKEGLIFSSIIYKNYDAPENDDQSVPLIISKYDYSGKILDFENFELDRFSNTDKLTSYYKLGNFPPECVKVSFSYVVNAGKTIIGSHHVRVRDSDNTNSDILETLNAGRDITVISRGKRESISPWGEYYWYKVAYEKFFIEDKAGFVFGAFLEPVEKKE